MLLGKKIRYTVGSDWAVILDRSTNEFAKNRAVDKLAQAFNLSAEEAKDLAENTPIILLDQLPLDLAEKIKDCFSQSNVDCSLTNDTFTKRKCFRAIWPAQPDLGRLIGETSEVSETETFIPPSKGVEEELNDLTLDLQKENEMFQSEYRQPESNPIEEKVSPPLPKEAGSAEDVLRRERIRFEDAMNRSRIENQALISKISEFETNLKQAKQAEVKAKQFQMDLIQSQKSLSEARAELENLKAASEKEIKTLKIQSEHYRNENVRTQNVLKQSQAETKQFQTELIQTQKSLSQARAEIEDLKSMLNQMQSDSVQLKEDTEQTKREVENKLHNQIAELEEWKRKANDWSGNYFKVIKENEFLRAHQSEELEGVKVRNQQLTTQLEQAQRQIREFVGQLEQQELIQKRMKAASEMADHEAQLKILVYKQRALEEEIRTREEEMKKILLDQEIVERAVVNAKQAQKYLMEQSKMKEKNRSTRPKIVNPSIQELGPQSDFSDPEPQSE